MYISMYSQLVLVNASSLPWAKDGYSHPWLSMEPSSIWGYTMELDLPDMRGRAGTEDNVSACSNDVSTASERYQFVTSACEGVYVECLGLYLRSNAQHTNSSYDVFFQVTP